MTIDYASFDVLTFDCYGTLIDWEKGFVRALLGAGIGDPLDRHRIVELTPLACALAAPAA